LFVIYVLNICDIDYVDLSSCFYVFHFAPTTVGAIVPPPSLHFPLISSVFGLVLV
jgi:hypothetical protein